MNTISKWAVALLIPLFFAPVAAQQCTTLVYQGAPITVTGSGPLLDNLVPLVGVVSLNQPLPVGSSSPTATFDFSATFPQLAGPTQTSPFTSGTFTFTTNSAGTITAWNMSLNYSTDSEQSNVYSATSTQAGDILNWDDEIASAGGPTVGTGTNTTAGTWTCLADVTGQSAALAAIVASLRTQLAGITAERDVYENLFRVADQEIATLEKSK
jgi:hypothetical protein